MGNIVYVVLYLTSASYVDGLVNSFVDPIVRGTRNSCIQIQIIFHNHLNLKLR
jgi:hypothetical protein